MFNDVIVDVPQTIDAINRKLDCDTEYDKLFANKLLAYEKSNAKDFFPEIQISTNPSDSSLSLDNTFKVLENDINGRKISSHTSELLKLIIDSYKIDKKFVFLNAGCQLISDESYENADGFELELEAARLLQERLHVEITKSNDSILIRESHEGTDDVIVEDSGGYPEYIYHIAKGKNGRMFLRIVKNIPLSKVICGERVSQMTKAYDDIEAVTRLLEEKEKDLELTVQIGKELLHQNHRLENRLVDAESSLKSVNENFVQLKSDLHQKNELLSILTNDGTVLPELDDNDDGASDSFKSMNLDVLQKRISSLQDENVKLRKDTDKLARDADECEEAERKLMEDLTHQLSSTNNQFDGINLELERHKEENSLMQDHITTLTNRLTETELRYHDLSAVNEENVTILEITKENQNLLATELAEFKIRYQEVLAMLNETQEQLRNVRKRGQPMARSSLITNMPVPQVDSLQSELLNLQSGGSNLMETSMFSEHSLDSGIALDKVGMGTSNFGITHPNAPGFKKVFETVRCASKSGHYSDNMLHLGVMSMSTSSQPKMSSYIQPGDSISNTQSYRNSMYSNSTGPSMDSSMAKLSSTESLLMSSDAESTYYPGQAPSGCPGAPGAKDLEAALNRLTPAEILARRAMLSHAPAGTYTYEENGNGIPLGFRTPDSIMSIGSYSMTGSGYSHNHWRLPDKLQIVKPMEGSQTLRHWNRLATPTLSGLLDERPGVTIRGGRGLDELGLTMYTLSDCEEDVPDDNPVKNYQQSSCIFTYTNSTVMHPDDGVSVISSVPASQFSSRMTSAATSHQPSASHTPRSLSRRNSTSTFSVNMGLASMLNERGIKAVTPSALNTPCGPGGWSPTVTPCNSPEGSPIRECSPEPQFLAGFLSSGAELLRRKLIGGDSPHHHHQSHKMRPGNKIILSKLEKRALRSIKILEKVENMGIESINPGLNSTNICPQLGTSSLYSSSSRSSSPMAQLTSLKKLNHPESGDQVHIGKEAIKAVLTKGLSCESLKSEDSSYRENTIVPSKSSAFPDETLTSHSMRMKQIQRQKSRRNLKNGHQGGQRPDLGHVTSSNTRGHLKKRAGSEDSVESQPIGFIGTISSMLFGRKGGLL